MKSETQKTKTENSTSPNWLEKFLSAKGPSTMRVVMMLVVLNSLAMTWTFGIMLIRRGGFQASMLMYLGGFCATLILAVTAPKALQAFAEHGVITGKQ